MRGRWSLLLGLLVACRDESLAPAIFAACGDGTAVEGEVCFAVERRSTEIPGAIVLPGDFDGDGTREYYVDGGGMSGHYAILAEGPESMVMLHQGVFAGKEGLHHAVYRASARDVDLDGATDLLTLMEYGYWAGDAENSAYCGVPMRGRDGFELRYEALLCWESDPGYQGQAYNRFDGTFGDFDGDGAGELLFAPNVRRAYVFEVEAGAADGKWLKLREELDFLAFGAQDNIITVAADLDGDGRDDLVLADGLGRVLTLRSDAQGHLATWHQTEAAVLPAMAATVLAQDLDRDGEVDLVGAATGFNVLENLPATLAIARGRGDGGFEPAATWPTLAGTTQTGWPWGSGYYVHLALLDLDESGYPALVYAVRDPRTLVVHPQVGRTLGAEAVLLPLDLEPAGVFVEEDEDGSRSLLVSFWADDQGTEDEADDVGPFLDRYRLDP